LYGDVAENEHTTYVLLKHLYNINILFSLPSMASVLFAT